jgi:hypothetical protein
MRGAPPRSSADAGAVNSVLVPQCGPSGVPLSCVLIGCVLKQRGLPHGMLVDESSGLDLSTQGRPDSRVARGEARAPIAACAGGLYCGELSC